MTRTRTWFALAMLAGCAAKPPVQPAAPPPPTKPAAPVLPSSPTEAAPALRLPSDVRPIAYRLALDVRPTSDRYSGTVEIDLALTEARQTFWLHADRAISASHVEVREGGRVHSAALLAADASGLRALVTDGPVSGRATLVIHFESPFNLRSEGLYKVTFDGAQYLFTQFESVYARKAFPCFDEPGWKAPLTLTLTVGADDVAAANTPIAGDEKTGTARVVRFKATAPLPTYLYAFTVGPLDVVDAPPIPPSTVRNQPLPLRGIAPRGKGGQLAMTLAEAPRILVALERYFGIAYPSEKLDLVAVPDFASGAMENAGLITFRSQYLLLDPHTASVNRRKALVEVMAHEMAHQWFGDLVTTAWWDDIWLNEAFASWVEIPISDEVHPEWRFPLHQVGLANRIMESDTLASARAVRQPIVVRGDIQNAFDGITYQKGSAVIDMFEHDVGTETFRSAIHDYLLAHEDGNATVDDLLAALDAAAKHDVGTSFHTFLDQPGVPLVRFGAPRCGAGGNSVALAQSRFVTIGGAANTDLRWQVPICARYDRDGHPDVACTLLKESVGTLALPGKACPKWIQPNADSRGYYRWTLPDKQLAALSKESPKLGDKDRLSVVNTVAAGYVAGAIPAADALGALGAVVRDPVPEVALSFVSIAQDVLSHTDDQRLRHAIQIRLAALYREGLRKVGYAFPKGEDDALTQRRTQLLSLLALVAEDPVIQTEVARLGRAFLGVDGDQKVHPEALAPEIAAYVAAAAVRRDPSLVVALTDRALGETDETARRNLLAALHGAVDEEAARKVRAIALDPRSRGNEVIGPYQAQLADPRLREVAWTDLQRNFDAISARLGDKVKGHLPTLAHVFCDEAHALEVEQFFAPRIASLSGGERNLRQTVESIRLCAARRAAQEPSARSWFIPVDKRPRR